MKRNVLLSLVLALLLCLGAAANEPSATLGTVELEKDQAIAFGAADFADVGEDHWAYESVKKAVSLGLVTGRGDALFAPNDTMTRAEAVTMLHRMAGSPEAKAASFADVASDSWYAAAVNWAAQAGVMNGVSDTEFAPAQGITRQEFLTVLYRMAGSVSGTEVMFTALYDEQFADSGELAVWAKPAMYWGVYKELIRGVAADRLAPLGAVTRAEAAAILVRYSEKLN